MNRRGRDRLICPFCEGYSNAVVDTRSSDALDKITRRRQCLLCGDRFNTTERVDPIQGFQVRKKSRHHNTL